MTIQSNTPTVARQQDTCQYKSLQWRPRFGHGVDPCATTGIRPHGQHMRRRVIWTVLTFRFAEEIERFGSNRASGITYLVGQFVARCEAIDPAAGV